MVQNCVELASLVVKRDAELKIPKPLRPLFVFAVAALTRSGFYTAALSTRLAGSAELSCPEHIPITVKFADVSVIINTHQTGLAGNCTAG